MGRLFSFIAMWGILIGLSSTLKSQVKPKLQDKKPLSKKESAEAIIKELPTSDKDGDGRVRRLFIAHKRLTDLTALRECPHLWYLEAAYNNLTSLKGIENCTELMSLNLNNNQVKSLDGIEKLTRLEELYLFGSDLTDISPLHKLKNLKCVLLTGNTDLTASQIAALGKSLPDCEILYESKPEGGEKKSVALPKGSRGATDEPGESWVTQKLTPFSTEVQRPKEWFFIQNHEGGNFSWVISKEKLEKAGQPFETGVEIKAFHDVSKKTRKSPEDFAKEYLEKLSVPKDGKVLHQLKQKAGPLTAFTRTLELPKGILATDVYWGDGKQLDVVVVVARRTPKNQWNASQPLLRKLTGFSLRAIVEGTRDRPQNDGSKDE